MLEAGKYFLRKQQRSVGVSEEELIKIAIKSLGLDDLTPFDPNQKIIEYRMRDAAQERLIQLSLRAFANETASESVAPGGGSVAAYVGALGVSLATMVANLSSHKRGWDEKWEFFSDWAEKGQQIKDALLKLVDEDTNAYNAILEAYRLPKRTENEQLIRKAAIQVATKLAIEVPFQTLKLAVESLEIIKAMAEHGNPNSVTDAGVGALCARAAAHGAFLNVKTNIPGLADKNYGAQILQAAETYVQQVDAAEQAILQIVHLKME
jgi:glutamate formiminotransferase/formiminotetrahydrofolate cyclodeaminase